MLIMSSFHMDAGNTWMQIRDCESVNSCVVKASTEASPIQLHIIIIPTISLGVLISLS